MSGADVWPFLVSFFGCKAQRATLSTPDILAVFLAMGMTRFVSVHSPPGVNLWAVLYTEMEPLMMDAVNGYCDVISDKTGSGSLGLYVVLVWT